ncbi:hypothetical protein [Rubritalea profundi]|uniref:Uncharacterized protein n=1 Tax=Rubritalea profundi TaxID=1658618 RepID=A0A2S7TYT6_9BACT|nr:hypothetical protein [Rubritalea profundi]PQJ27915.1 hypothetical protein BSZ32_04975 [Rubritalea profundi]
MANKHTESRENLIQAIRASHAKAEHDVAWARRAMDKAIASKLETAALTETYSRKAKHTICHDLRGIMSGEEVKDHMCLHRISKRRALKSDKRQLSIVGLLDKSVRNVATKVQPSKTVSTIMTKTSKELTKKLRQRPVTAWTVEEKENFKRSLAPYLQILKESQE